MRRRIRTLDQKSEQQSRAQIEAFLKDRFEADFIMEGNLEEKLTALCRSVTRSSDPKTRRLTLSAALYLLLIWLRDRNIGYAAGLFVDTALCSSNLDVRAFGRGVDLIATSQLPIIDIDRLYMDAL